MPRFDGTGPVGKGPRTGRGLGYCSVGKKPRKPKDNAAQKVLNAPYWQKMAKKVNLLKGK